MKPFARMILGTTLALAAGCVSTLKVDNVPVAALELNRYLGEWYEIARFDHSFERGVERGRSLGLGQVSATRRSTCLRPGCGARLG